MTFEFVISKRFFDGKNLIVMSFHILYVTISKDFKFCCFCFVIKPCGFGTTWAWLNDGLILIFGCSVSEPEIHIDRQRVIWSYTDGKSAVFNMCDCASHQHPFSFLSLQAWIWLGFYLMLLRNTWQLELKVKWRTALSKRNRIGGPGAFSHVL